MKKMAIYEPALCCPTGLCGVGVDTELLRISAVLNKIKNSGVEVGRFNLSSAPMEFVKNTTVKTFLRETGVDGLPVTTLDGEIVIQGRYPRNEEFVEMLGLPKDLLEEAGKGEI